MENFDILKNILNYILKNNKNKVYAFKHKLDINDKYYKKKYQTDHFP